MESIRKKESNRKLTIGDPKTGMTFVIGSPVFGGYSIHEISFDDRAFVTNNIIRWFIFVINDDLEVKKWKTVWENHIEEHDLDY